jgi:hypothetical protein
MHRLRLTLVAVVPLALIAAGCGGGRTSAGVASVASSTTTAATTSPSQGSLLAFSQCMRTNGVASFPNPQHLVGGNVKLTIHGYGSPGPRFEAALNACNHLLPSGGPQQADQQTRTQVADELSFARCMRSHGLANFPDPNARGLTVAMVQAQGIDVHSATVLRVVQKCLPASHGALTAAKVREAIANH